jgi:nucleotide-binding universal stress UspA family protein
MKTLPPILAGVDFSSSSSQVLGHAARLAAASGCRLIAAHVIPSNTIREWENTTGLELRIADHLEETTNRLQELVDECSTGVPTAIEVRIGTPHKVLAEIVREQGADLLILGAHDVSRRRLGSVASHCARSVPADILLLRDWQERFFHHIAACVDFSQNSAAVVARAIKMAAAHRASLEIIHVIFPPGSDPWGRVMEQPMDAEISYETRVRERARLRMDEFLRPFAGLLDGIDSKVLILESSSPAAAITAHVDVVGIDLTVTGSGEGSWLADLVLGSNTERLLHDSTSSVLVVRG